MNKIKLLLLALFLLINQNVYSWGFLAHRYINRHAVYLLPEPMISFYKKHIEYIAEHAIDPDKRGQVVEDEAVRHYFDADVYGKNPFEVMPRKWKDAVAKYTEDTLQTYGILPWNINWYFSKLVKAFKDKDVDRILYISASLGHYIGDATVPLHCTEYYDGKEPAQKGIHAFWETRMIELFVSDFNFFIGKAEYVKNPLTTAWQLVENSHYAVDTIFSAEISLRKTFPSDKKYIVIRKYGENKAQITKEYAIAFDKLTNKMVERKLCIATQFVASFWYSAWVNAGQPDLTSIENEKVSEKQAQKTKELEEEFQKVFIGEDPIR